MPRRSKIMASSFMSAMFRSRWVFSMTLAASAVLMSRAGRSRPDHAAVQFRQEFRALGALPGHDLGDGRERVDLVPGIDALR
jgi:hypothetical protein